MMMALSLGDGRSRKRRGITTPRRVLGLSSRAMFRRMKTVRIGNGQGFWGDSIDAPVELLRGGEIDYLGMDYLAEVTLSIMMRQKLKNPEAGYATDFIGFVRRVLPELVERNVRVYSSVGLGIGLLVVLAALLLVGNTVRLTIYARRLLIRTMKLVGATDGFIRRPFLVEGVLQGLLGGVVAALIVWMIYTGLQGLVVGLGAEGWPGGSAFLTLFGLILLGVLLGWLASWIAVRRFIKKVRLS